MISVERRAAIAVVPFASALASVAAVLYVLCALLALVAPGLFLAVFQTWVHGVNLSVLATGVPFVTPLGFIIGLVTFTLTAWLFGAAWAALYNTWSGTREARA